MIKDMIKALRCLASQDENGDCYMQHYNTLHLDDDEPAICCTSEPSDERVKCPYYQNKYEVCFEDGECGEWLSEAADILEIVRQYPEWPKSGKWIPADQPPSNNNYILISFENFSVPQVGRYEGDEEGGAFYVGDEEESCISQELIVNAWRPLPELYKEDVEETFGCKQPVEKEEIIKKDERMAADIKQAIEYFKGELSQMDVFSDIVSFREAERKSIETALKVLQRIQEESQTGQQAMFDIAQITVSQNMAAGQEEHYGGNKDMPGMRQGIHRPHQKVL